MSAAASIKLFTKRTFLPLFVLFQAGTFNDNLLKNALIALVTFGSMVFFSENIPSGAVVPIAALLFTLPFLIFCTIAGQIADKVDRSLVLKWVKRAEVAIMIFAAVGLLAYDPAPGNKNLLSVVILSLALVLMGTQSAFFSPTKNAVLPQWLDDKELVPANGVMSGFQFFTILLGMVVGLALANKACPDSFFNGPHIIAAVLLLFAVIGWIAAEKLPDAPAPKADLKIDWNPITSIIGVLKTSLEHMPVFKPMMGIAWFYGFSNVMILVMPNMVKEVLVYDENVLALVLVSSTLAILVGALLCAVLSRGGDNMGLIAIGIVGVTLFTLDLYLSTDQSARTELGDTSQFLADPATPRFLAAVIGSSLCAGLYVIPLQAMAQRRAPNAVRARLMSAGAVMLNAAVNIVTLVLIGLGYLALAPQTPFLMVAIISTGVAAYVLLRFVQKRKNTTVISE